MDMNDQVIARMRDLASRGASVRPIVDEVRNDLRGKAAIK